MAHQYAEIAFTDGVKAMQTAQGSRALYARRDQAEGVTNDALGPREAAFIAERDSLYMATVSETGWPYVQHRGGPAGFVKVIDAKTLGFADFSGNRQYVSLGNLAADNRVSIIFMDYAHKRRLKLFGRVRVVERDDTETLEALASSTYQARIERGLLIDVEALDWNCPQHITQRFTAEEIAEAVAPLHARIAELESQLAGNAATSEVFA